jgi:hypothetical protein
MTIALYITNLQQRHTEPESEHLLKRSSPDFELWETFSGAERARSDLSLMDLSGKLSGSCGK